MSFSTVDSFYVEIENIESFLELFLVYVDELDSEESMFPMMDDDDLREWYKDREEQLYSKKISITIKRKELKEVQDAINSADLNALTAESLSSFDAEARYFLWKQIQIALAINKEFDFPEARQRLRLIVDDPRTIKITPTSPGKISISINMSIAGGNLEDYGQAIQAVREEGNFGQKDPAIASFFWRRFLYQVVREGAAIPERKSKKSKGKSKESGEGKEDEDEKGKPRYEKAELEAMYWDTMNGRLTFFEESENVAPFWGLINYGNASASLSSNRGGTAYPVTPPTNFIRKAEAEIRENYKTRFDGQKESYVSQLHNLLFRINQIMDELDRLYQLIIQYDSNIKTRLGIDFSVPDEEWNIIKGLQGRERYTQLEMRQRRAWEAENRLAELSEARYQAAKDAIQRRLIQYGNQAKASAEKIEEYARRMAEGEYIGERVYMGGGVYMRTPRLIGGVYDV